MFALVTHVPCFHLLLVLQSIFNYFNFPTFILISVDIPVVVVDYSSALGFGLN